MAAVLPDMEAGVETCVPLRLPTLLGNVLKKHEIQNADAHAFLEHAVALPGPYLFCEHLREVKEGAVSPYPQLGELNLNVDLLIAVEQEAYV